MVFYCQYHFRKSVQACTPLHIPINRYFNDNAASGLRTHLLYLMWISDQLIWPYVRSHKTISLIAVFILPLQTRGECGGRRYSPLPVMSHPVDRGEQRVHSIWTKCWRHGFKTFWENRTGRFEIESSNIRVAMTRQDQISLAVCLGGFLFNLHQRRVPKSFYVILF